MKVLIVGQGGREHAFAYALAKSPDVSEIYIAPGNAGTMFEKKCQNIDIEACDIGLLKAFALKNKIDYCLVGPEAPLTKAIVDEFRAAGLNIIGPTEQAARLESSKIFCKEFLTKYQIPTASFASFDDCEQALAYVQTQDMPVVIKADGLAAGKGVTIATSLSQAETTIRHFMQQKAFGNASTRIIIEQYLTGEEASFIVLCDGKNYIPLATAQDHKARDEGDRGPNTGGMGAYSPAKLLSKNLEQKVLQTIIEPTLRGLQQDGIHFTGFLYAGLMIDKDTGTIKLLEYNVRCGDPETQVILMRLKSDFHALCLATVNQTLSQMSPTWDPQPALGVVMACKGYPDSYQTGDPITGLQAPKRSSDRIFHAGTQSSQDGFTLTSGGRVLCVCSLGSNLAQAAKAAYEQIKGIHWQNQYYRRDIGSKALE